MRLATKLANTCERRKVHSPLTPQPPISPSQVLPYPPRRVGLNLPSSTNHPLLVFCPSIPCLTKKSTRNTNPPKNKVMSDEPQNRGNFFCPFLQSCYPNAFICVRKPEFQIHQYAFLLVRQYILKTQMKKCPSTSQSTTNSSFHFISPSCSSNQPKISTNLHKTFPHSTPSTYQPIFSSPKPNFTLED